MTPLDFIDKPINPPGPHKFTVISTFSGCGGSSLGYKWAGGKVLAAVEWEQNAVDTYKLNHLGTPVLHRDIATVTAQELFDLCHIGPGELDIFDGSPPCQGFSTAGKRQMDDPRNSLFREYVRLLKDLQPKVMIMENVSGMVKGNMKLAFVEILQELKSCGYVVKAWLLNAKYFGVPQSRERIIFVGVREDLGIVPTCPPANSLVISLGTAIQGLVPSDTELLSPLYLTYWKKAKPGDAMGKSFADWKADPAKPANTVRLNAHIAHWSVPRWLALNEFARIGSFPDAFQWTDRRNGTRRIGNTVPPKFMQGIASHVYETILEPSHG